MKFLFDENLSHTLVSLLADVFLIVSTFEM